MYIYIYSIHIRIYTYIIHIYIYIYMCVCVRVICIYVYLYIYVRTEMCVYIYIYTHAYIHYTYVYIHMYVCICVYVCMHTYSSIVFVFSKASSQTLLRGNSSNFSLQDLPPHGTSGNSTRVSAVKGLKRGYVHMYVYAKLQTRTCGLIGLLGGVACTKWLRLPSGINEPLAEEASWQSARVKIA